MSDYNYILDSAHIQFVHACMHVLLEYKKWRKEQIVENVEKIYYIRKGKCEIVINGVKYIVSAGEMILIPSNSLISFRLPGKNCTAEQDFLHFDAKIGTKSIFDYIAMNSYIIKPEKDIAEYFFGELTKTLEDPMEDMLHRHYILTELILYFMRKAGGHFIIPTPKKNIDFDKLLDFIDQTIIDSDCTVENLARIVNMNVNYFICEFKKQYGITPGKYLENTRIERTKKFLTETSLPINIIASSLGYSSYEVMSKAFKRREGVSPKAYREMNREAVNEAEKTTDTDGASPDRRRREP